MRHNILYFIIALIAPFAVHTAYAQNLDPTVEVNRDYEGKLLIVHKPILDMAVPDSVYKFDLDFDYSVTDTPYKGAYEFVPYSLESGTTEAVVVTINLKSRRTGTHFSLQALY